MTHRSLARLTGILIVLVACRCPDSLRGAEPNPATPEGIAFFETKIRPVLIDHCYRCHSDDGQGVRGGLLVDSRHGLRDGGDSGPAIVPGELEESWLWNAINYEDFRMPPNRKLSPETIADFRRWIEMGAPDPREAETQTVETNLTPEQIEAGKQFWAFQKPLAGEPPETVDASWAITEVDRHILHGIESAGLRPASDANPYQLLRRLHFDLHGLPPSVTAIERFLSGWRTDPDAAVRREVDRLLESPRFGERWGRHWLDVARYAESSGKESDMTFPHAWRYRDYVIDSFNADKPYDRFVREQIAGDLLPAETDEEWTENLIATGFLAIGPKGIAEQNPRQFRADLIDEQIDTTTRAILGISVACARCHDHKFDPIPQTDYYALAGIFESTDTFFGGVPSQRIRRASDLLILPIPDPNPFDRSISRGQRDGLEARLAELRRELAETRRVTLRPASPAETPSGSPTAMANRDPARRLLNRAVLDRQIAGITAQLAAVDDDGQPLSLCMGVQARHRPVNARVLVRGEINRPAQEVERGFVQVIGPSSGPIDSDSDGRLELARWLTSPENPLTARVMVNRIWQHLIGAPLVAETDNFGASGSPPTHPQLLDLLAVRFMESGWSVKQMVRLITGSRVYRLSSSVDPATRPIDPENRLLSHGHVRRLEAEAIRDAMLAVSGTLETARPRASLIATYGLTILGPDGQPPRLPIGRSPNAAAFPAAGFTSNGHGSADSANYRSVYLPIARNSVPRPLEVFDFADPTMLVGGRDTSDTANQSLYLLNHPLVIRLSDDFAEQLRRTSRSPRQSIRLAFLAAYGRPATLEELRRAERFMREVADDRPATPPARPTFAEGRFRGDPRGRFTRTPPTDGRAAPTDDNEPLRQFCQALFVSAEFRYLQ